MQLPDKLAVRVFDEDIEAGEEQSGTSCPVALAIRSRLKKLGLKTEGMYVYVDRGEVQIGNETYTAAGLLDWTTAFDEGGRSKVNPTTFNLERLLGESEEASG